jgi:IS605 OrfB family transposase
MQTQRTITLLLEDDPDLRHTMLAYHQVQQALSPVCFHQGNPLPARRLHDLTYYNVKGKVSSQMTCSAIRSVAAAYKSARTNGRPAQRPFQFQKPTALFLIGKRGRDAEILSDHRLAFWTPNGKKVVSFRVPAYFEERFQQAVEFDSLLVIERKGRLLGRLVVTLTVPDPEGDLPCGLDRGELNAIAAVDACGKVFFRSGRRYRQKNKASHKRRKRLQQRLALKKAESKDTRSVRRALKRLSRKAANRTREFVRMTAKRLIRTLPSGSVLVLEDLRSLPQPTRTRKDASGQVIQSGNRKGKSLRRRLSRWQYGSLQKALLARAQLLGVPVALVSAAYTSRICHVCQERGIRKRHRFFCPRCGYEGHADLNAATNIRNRWNAFAVYLHGGRSVNAPRSPVEEATTSSYEGKPLTLGSGH